MSPRGAGGRGIAHLQRRHADRRHRPATCEIGARSLAAGDGHTVWRRAYDTRGATGGRLNGLRVVSGESVFVAADLRRFPTGDNGPLA